MKVKTIMLFAVIVGMTALNSAFNPSEAQTAWLKKAQLGPHAPATQDWKAIEAAARQEGKVVIYSVSSRIPKLKEEFEEKFGEITTPEQGFEPHAERMGFVKD